MKHFLRLPLILVLAACSFASFAASVTGTWHGKFVIDTSTLPKPTNPADADKLQKQLAIATAMLAKTKLTLTLNPNKTYRMVGENVPRVTGTQISDGVYTQKGNDLTFVSKTKNGKPATAAESKPQHVAVKGNSLVIPLPQTSQVKISLVFTR